MVNGAVAKTTNIGVIIIVLVSVIGVILLGLTDDEVPPELSMLLTSCIGFLVGTRFTPLGDYKEKDAGNVKPNDVVTVKENGEKS